MKDRGRLRAKSEAGSVLLLALFVMIIISLLGTALLTLSGVEHNIAHNGVWSEGAFFAAEAGVQAGINQLSPLQDTASQAIPVTSIATSYSYRSGHKTDSGAQPLTFKGARNESGYSLSSRMGYVPKGYCFYPYQIDATGTGPRNAQREVEVLAEYGPISC